jgi:phosphoesterase RecJ-like protein
MQSEVLYKTQFFKDNKVGIIVFTKELFEKYNLTIRMTDGAVNKVLDIDTVFIAIAITEVAQNSYKVSIRSKNPYSADYIASKYGGGGHFNASGCRINGNIYNVIEGLVKNASDELNI